MKQVTRSAEETVTLGKTIGQQLKRGQILCLFGDLGAGKTTLIKGIASGATGCSPDEVLSPTFVYHAIYEGTMPLHHFDLYRLPNAEAFLELGFDEYLHTDGACCIEWAERIETILPAATLRIAATHTADGHREFTIDGL